VSGKGSLPRKLRERRYTEDASYAAFVRRAVRGLGYRAAMDDLESAEYLRAIEADLEEAWCRAVAGWRGAGYTDGQIGDQLGITRQAIQFRWPREESTP
jgi:hypothetical protein